MGGVCVRGEGGWEECVCMFTCVGVGIKKIVREREREREVGETMDTKLCTRRFSAKDT